MKITLLCIGKTDEKYLKEGIEIYSKRLKHYIKYNIVELPDIKNAKHLSFDQQKSKEAELIFKNVNQADFVILLDENGSEFNSIQLADFLNKKMLASVQHLVFIIGGPYGFDKYIYERANDKLSLSKLTFSHQMVRLFFTEQIYRALTILKGEPYHHQ